ncbi:hypothetical protein BDD12DRAFT_882890 [Trichophaea hybrida]|nr:hypothetical protein BDD12DRAFT_882890 [Trichophaea hybrida]
MEANIEEPDEQTDIKSSPELQGEEIENSAGRYRSAEPEMQDSVNIESIAEDIEKFTIEGILGQWDCFDAEYLSGGNTRNATAPEVSAMTSAIEKPGSVDVESLLEASDTTIVPPAEFATSPVNKISAPHQAGHVRHHRRSSAIDGGTHAQTSGNLLRSHTLSAPNVLTSNFYSVIPRTWDYQALLEHERRCKNVGWRAPYTRKARGVPPRARKAD